MEFANAMILIIPYSSEMLACLDTALLISAGSSQTVKANVTVLLTLIILSKKIPARQSQTAETKLVGMTIYISVSALQLSQSSTQKTNPAEASVTGLKYCAHQLNP
jgi:hypothetical protein